MKCNLCNDEWPDSDGLESIIDHLRVMHPKEDFGQVERWPDGGLVIHDDTIEPGDFT